MISESAFEGLFLRGTIWHDTQRHRLYVIVSDNPGEALGSKEDV